MNQRLRVLLIEDDEDDSTMVQALLAGVSSAGFEVDWVRTYEEGIEAVCRRAHDVCLLDSRLGERDGLELLKEAISEGCEAPVILLTSQGGREADLEVMSSGAADYLVKSQITSELLERSIRYSIERKRTESELRRYREHLEELVRERTAQLSEKAEAIEASNEELHREIAERARAEEAYTESEEKYRTLVESALDIIFTVLSDGTISSLNPAFELITGWPPGEWVGKDFSSLIHPEDFPSLREAFKRILHGETVPAREVRILSKSGGYRIIELKTVPQAKKGHIVGVIGTARDVTERRHAEERVREQKEFLTDVLESLSHPFTVIDADTYRIKMANSAAAPSGLPEDITCYALTHRGTKPCDGSEHFCPLEAIKRTKKPAVTEHVHYDRDGNARHVEVHGYPILDEKGTVVQIIEYSLDITERKRMEEELREARDQLASERSLLQAVVSQMPSGVIVAEPGGRIILMNEQATGIMGHPHRLTSRIEEYCGDYRFFHTDGRPYEPEEYPLARSLQRGEIVLGEESRLILPDGTSRIIHASSSPITDSEGAIVAGVLIFYDVTEQKEALEALHRREQEYRALVENSPDAIVRFDRDLRRVYVNPAIEALTGYPVSAFIGKTIHEPRRKGRLEFVRLLERACRKVFASGEEEKIESPYVTPEGPKHFHIRVVPELSREGRVETLLTIYRDVTELKQAQEEITKREELLRTVIETMPVAVWVSDEKGNIVIGNSMGERLWGARKLVGIEQFREFKGWRMDSGKRIESHEWALARAIRKGETSLEEEILVETFEGERKVLLNSAVPVFSKEGRLIAGIAINQDITERKQMEQELRRARDELELRVKERTAELERAIEALRLDEARLEALLELSQMTEASIEQIADYVMEQQVKLTQSRIGWLGFTNEDESILTLHTLSQSVRDRCTISHEPAHFSLEDGGVWADAVRERKPIIVNDYSDPHPRKKGYPEGHVPLSRVMVIPVFDGSRIAVVAAVGNKEEEYNASDLRQSTLLMDGMWKLIQRRRAEDALRESASLAAMGRALSSLAHDMKTPLVAIGGFTRLVQRRLEADRPLFEKLEIVVNETQRLEKMVKNMLDFSRPMELERTEEDVGKLVAECLAVAKPVAGEREVHLESRVPRDLPPLMLDAARIKQAVINLLVNAIQASPEGGTVVVAGTQNRRRLLIDVIDHGPGVPPERRGEIFAPFFTTKKEGTGLGLSIVKKIVEAHRGRIAVLNNPDKGATFRVELPYEEA